MHTDRQIQRWRQLETETDTDRDKHTEGPTNERTDKQDRETKTDTEGH